jgi:hypothetical protein
MAWAFDFTKARKFSAYVCWAFCGAAEIDRRKFKAVQTVLFLRVWLHEIDVLS